MREPHHFLQLALPRFTAVGERLKPRVWKKLADVACTRGGPSRAYLPFEKAAPVPGHDPFATCAEEFTFTWYGLSLPETPAGAPAYLKWDHEGESNLHVLGQPHAGYDPNHKFHFIPAGLREARVHVMTMNTPTRLKEAALYARNETAWHALRDWETLQELAKITWDRIFPNYPARDYGCTYRPPLDFADTFSRRLFRLLDQACDALERDGVDAFRAACARIWAECPADPQALTVTASGHGHIDLVWLVPESCTEFKAVHTFSSMLRLMEDYPEMTFGYSQPASYQAVRRLEPALEQRVRARAREGRWDVEGAMWVESDCWLPCGEGLVRSFTVGQEGFRELNDRPSRVLWAPDTFGFPSCLPQIMKQTGVEYFYTTKLHWNPITFFPHTSFAWRGADGSEVLAHVSQHDQGYTLDSRVSEMRQVERVHRQGDIHPEALVPLGHGDGGGGVTAEQCERLRRMGNLYGCPPSRWGGIDAFFARMEPLRARLPAWHGELSLEYHRGTFTTQSLIKRLFRAAERGLQTSEAARCASGGGPLPAVWWERMIFAQFHDYVPGSAINLVYEEAQPELEAHIARSLAAAADDLAAPAPSTQPPAFHFNPLPYARTVVVSDDKLLALPPLGTALLSAATAPLPAACVEAGPRSLRNTRVAATFDDAGHLVALVVDGHAVRLRGPCNRLAIYPEMPTAFDAWDIDRPSLTLGVWVDTPAEVIASTANSPACAKITFRRALGKHSSAVTTYELRADEPALRVTVDLDWRETACLLKAHFPTDYLSREARFGSPFGSTTRPQRPGMPHEEAQWEVPGSRWAAIYQESETDGLAIITEAKFGFAARDGDLTLSLVRSPRCGGGAKIPAETFNSTGELPPRWDHPFTDIGTEHIQYALTRHNATGRRADQPAALADLLYTATVPAGAPASAGLVALEGGETLQPAWAKPVDAHTWVLRLHETLGQHGVCCVRLAVGFQFQRVDLLEQLVTVSTSTNNDDEIVFRPYEIISLRVRRNTT